MNSGTTGSTGQAQAHPTRIGNPKRTAGRRSTEAESPSVTDAEAMPVAEPTTTDAVFAVEPTQSQRSPGAETEAPAEPTADTQFTQRELLGTGEFWTADGLALLGRAVIASGNHNTTDGFLGGIRHYPEQPEPMPIPDNVTAGSASDLGFVVTGHADGTAFVYSESDLATGRADGRRLARVSASIDSVLVTASGDILIGADSVVWRYRAGGDGWAEVERLVDFAPLQQRSSSPNVFGLMEYADGSFSELLAAIYLPDGSILWSSFTDGLQLYQQSVSYDSDVTDRLGLGADSGEIVDADSGGARQLRSSADGGLVITGGNEGLGLWRNLLHADRSFEVLDVEAVLATTPINGNGFAVSFFDSRIVHWIPLR